MNSLQKMEYTGERMVPEVSDYETFWEHIYRYRFAASFVQGQSVLDIACGEGYGAAALQQSSARRVVGIDYSEIACRHTHSRYGVHTIIGDAAKLPLAKSSIDIVTSYETIEHIASPEAFLRECIRILRPGGKLIVSTPNRNVYSGQGHFNPFHCSEMTRQEFTDLLTPYFGSIKLYFQRPTLAPMFSSGVFASDTSVWHRAPGFHFVSKAVQAVLFRHLTGDLKQEVRQSPVSQILKRDLPLLKHSNKFAVQELRLGDSQEPRYFIAVASV